MLDWVSCQCLVIIHSMIWCYICLTMSVFVCVEWCRSRCILILINLNMLLNRPYRDTKCYYTTVHTKFQWWWALDKYNITIGREWTMCFYFASLFFVRSFCIFVVPVLMVGSVCAPLLNELLLYHFNNFEWMRCYIIVVLLCITRRIITLISISHFHCRQSSNSTQKKTNWRRNKTIWIQ